MCSQIVAVPQMSRLLECHEAEARGGNSHVKDAINWVNRNLIFDTAGLEDLVGLSPIIPHDADLEVSL